MTTTSENHLKQIYQTLGKNSPEPVSPYRSLWSGFTPRKRRGILYMAGIQENEKVYIEAQYCQWDDLAEFTKVSVKSQVDLIALELRIFAENLKIYQHIVADLES